MRKPNFNNVIKVLNREEPDRPTLFEFSINHTLCRILAGEDYKNTEDDMSEIRMLIQAFMNAGYDYINIMGSAFRFPKNKVQQLKTRSLNDSAIIFDRETFETYPWPNPDDFDYSILEKAEALLPDGMKILVRGAGGVLENVIELVGFDNLCYMLVDDPDLVQDLFDAVGSRFVRYYEICASFPSVGALVSNDDWGFKTQTMMAPSDMRKYVIPWHKEIVKAIHKTGKPAILHSCGNLKLVMDDIIDVIGYDAKHSYEDAIMPVEDAYELYGDRIAVLGGLDVDFICRSSPENIRKRARSMRERSKGRGGYALGTGNSVPDYVPIENYMAMISVANEG